MAIKPIQEWTGADFILFAKSVDRKTWIRVGGIALAVVLFAVFVGWPAWFMRTHVKTMIQVIEGQIVRLETQRRNEKGWRKDKEECEKFIAGVHRRLYDMNRLSLLLGEISKLAEESGVSVIASRPQDKPESFPKPYDAKYRADLYDFTVEGDYHALGRFISRIESHERQLRVQFFNINPREKNPESHILNLTLSAVSLTETKAKGGV